MPADTFTQFLLTINAALFTGTVTSLWWLSHAIAGLKADVKTLKFFVYKGDDDGK